MIRRSINQKLEGIVYNNEFLYQFVRMFGISLLYNAYGNYKIGRTIKHIKASATNSLIIEHAGIKMKLDNSSLHDLGFAALNKRGQIYEQETTEYLKRFIKNGTVFIDAGANNGFFSLFVSKQLEGTGKIYAFEPVPHTYERFLDNIKLNRFTNIIPYKLALADNEHNSMINISDIEDGLNSLNPIYRSSMRIPVHVTTLDKVIKAHKIDIMKIDVEGLEEKVMRGALNIIESNERIHIIFERNVKLIRPGSDNGINFLIGLGFRVYILRQINGHLNMKEISSDHRIGSCTLLASRNGMPNEL